MKYNNIYDWSEFVPNEFIYQGRWIYNWFSNMIESEIEIDGIFYRSVENYFQASKTLDELEHLRIARVTPNNSKRLGRKVTLRPNWEQLKTSVMQKGLVAKFQQHDKFAQKLSETPFPIIEWNNWNDKIWGVSVADNKGRNLLGCLLMDLVK